MFNNKVVHLCYRMAILVLLLIGIINSVVLICHGIYIDNFYTYFTNISNYFAFVVFLLVFISTFKECIKGDTRGHNKSYVSLKFQATVSSFVTFVIFDFIIYFVAWKDTWFFNIGTATFHTLCPLLIFFDYIFFDEHFKLRVRDIFYTLIFPAVYAVLTTIFCAVIPNYPPPYFFLDLHEVNFWQLILWYIIFLSIFLMFSSVFWLWNRTYYDLNKKLRIDFKNKHRMYEYKDETLL